MFLEPERPDNSSVKNVSSLHNSPLSLFEFFKSEISYYSLQNESQSLAHTIEIISSNMRLGAFGCLLSTGMQSAVSIFIFLCPAHCLIKSEWQRSFPFGLILFLCFIVWPDTAHDRYCEISWISQETVTQHLPHWVKDLNLLRVFVLRHAALCKCSTHFWCHIHRAIMVMHPWEISPLGASKGDIWWVTNSFWCMTITQN